MERPAPPAGRPLGRLRTGGGISATCAGATSLHAPDRAIALTSRLSRPASASTSVEWTLDPDLRAKSATHVARCAPSGAKVLECTQCGGLRVGGQACPCCGFLPTRPPKAVPIADGDLGLVENGRAKPPAHKPHEWYPMLAYIAVERGYKPGWAAYKYKEKFGAWPPRGNVVPIEPSPEVRSWVRSRMIAYARRPQASRGAA